MKDQEKTARDAAAEKQRYLDDQMHKANGGKSNYDELIRGFQLGWDACAAYRDAHMSQATTSQENVSQDQRNSDMRPVDRSTQDGSSSYRDAESKPKWKQCLRTETIADVKQQHLDKLSEHYGAGPSEAELDAAQSEASAELDHPCKQTCSGWRQGFERGRASIEVWDGEKFVPFHKRTGELEDKLVAAKIELEVTKAINQINSDAASNGSRRCNELNDRVVRLTEANEALREETKRLNSKLVENQDEANDLRKFWESEGEPPLRKDTKWMTFSK